MKKILTGITVITCVSILLTGCNESEKKESVQKKSMQKEIKPNGIYRCSNKGVLSGNVIDVPFVDLKVLENTFDMRNAKMDFSLSGLKIGAWQFTNIDEEAKKTGDTAYTKVSNENNLYKLSIEGTDKGKEVKMDMVTFSYDSVKNELTLKTMADTNFEELSKQNGASLPLCTKIN